MFIITTTCRREKPTVHWPKAHGPVQGVAQSTASPQWSRVNTKWLWLLAVNSDCSDSAPIPRALKLHGSRTYCEQSLLTDCAGQQAAWALPMWMKSVRPRREQNWQWFYHYTMWNRLSLWLSSSELFLFKLIQTPYKMHSCHLCPSPKSSAPTE